MNNYNISQPGVDLKVIVSNVSFKEPNHYYISISCTEPTPAQKVQHPSLKSDDYKKNSPKKDGMSLYDARETKFRTETVKNSKTPNFQSNSFLFHMCIINMNEKKDLVFRIEIEAYKVNEEVI